MLNLIIWQNWPHMPAFNGGLRHDYLKIKNYNVWPNEVASARAVKYKTK